MTPEEREHIRITKEHVGCLPCLLDGWVGGHADYHHIADGRKRAGHLHGYGMCLWHHRGERHPFQAGRSMSYLEEKFGPSFARTKKKFLAEYGSQTSLSATNTYAVSLWRDHQWVGIMPPYEQVVLIREFHVAR